MEQRENNNTCPNLKKGVSIYYQVKTTCTRGATQYNRHNNRVNGSLWLVELASTADDSLDESALSWTCSNADDSLEESAALPLLELASTAEDSLDQSAIPSWTCSHADDLLDESATLPLLELASNADDSLGELAIDSVLILTLYR